MLRFIKNSSFVLSVISFFVGLPWGVSEMLAENYTSGGVITAISAAIFILIFFGLARYLHNKDIHVTLPGYITGLVSLILCSGALFYFSLVDSVIFSKFFIIALATGLHSMVEAEFAFWIQKIGILLALLLVAFFQSLFIIIVGGVIVLSLFIFSIQVHAKGIKETNEKQ